MTRFDRAAPGEGMIVYSRIENGKAYLEFQFFLKTDDCASFYLADIRVYDMSGRLALEMLYPLQEEELAKGMILHPHLWKGISDSYRYSITVLLLETKKEKIDQEKIENMAIDNEKVPLDRLERQLPLRNLEEIPKKGWFLNGEAFVARTVLYELATRQFLRCDCEIEDVGAYRRKCIKEELILLRQMGANTISLNYLEYDEEFNVLCDEMGLLVWYGEKQKGIPEQKELFAEDGTIFDLYYFYKGSWSSEPFVYIVSKSLKQQKNGNYSLTVYSNQKRIALYVEGVLFEFQAGAPEFAFEEIPAKKYPLQLAAEAGECRAAFTAYDI